MAALPVLVQLTGAVAVLVGLFLLLPVGAALVIGGALTGAVGIGLEVARTPRRKASTP